MVRNFSAIQDVPCIATKIALATCEEDRVLARLAQAFPECFNAPKEEFFVGVWSKLRKEWWEWFEKGTTDPPGDIDEQWFNCEWDIIVPVELKEMRFGKTERCLLVKPLPGEIIMQLEKVTDLSRPIILVFNNEEYVAGFDNEDENICSVEQVQSFGQDGSDEFLTLYPKRLIIFDEVD